MSFTYSVKWKQANNIRNRWDTYLLPPNPERYKYASLNSIIVATLLSTTIGLILYKTSHHRTSPNQDDKDIKVNCVKHKQK